ncbi:Uncharacterized protein APZ42_031419 [Daphnia magna]|uniref:Uncharacterized protein n=1 Tax=Daphnia magna TaxID=35525 RepID=A0A164MVV3_9CRUS|nr:Uncharacterized protein APZ42_031419 [Daphnia magna]
MLTISLMTGKLFLSKIYQLISAHGQILNRKDLPSLLLGTGLNLTMTKRFLFICAVPPHCGDPKEMLENRFSRILRDFDNATICKGVLEEKFGGIKYCAGALFEKEDCMRSTAEETNCRVIARKTYPECYCQGIMDLLILPFTE